MSTGGVSALGPALSPRSVVRALWKWKWLILGAWIAGVGITAVTVFSLEPVYNADALILVESQKIPENFVAPTIQTALEARLDRLKQQVLSRERLWSLIQSLNLYPKLRRTRTQEEVIEAMRKDISIGLERGWSANRPGAFRVSYKALTAKTAAEVANRIGNFFITENLREREQEANGTSEFLDSQLEDAKRNLQEQEGKLREFKMSYNGELPEQEAGLLASEGQSRTEQLAIQDSIGRAQQNKLVLESSLAVARDSLTRLQELNRRRVEARASQARASGVPIPTGEPMTELEQVQARLQTLRMRYEDKYPEIQALMVEETRLLKAEKDHPRPRVKSGAPSSTGSDAAVTDVEGVGGGDALVEERGRVETLQAQIALTNKEIENLESKQKNVLREVMDVQSRIAQLPMREQQLASITRDYETSKANYKSLLDKKMAAEVAANMEKWQKAERFVMLDVAEVPEKPASPNRPVLMGGGTMLSLLLAAGIAFLLELKRNVFLGEWELPAGIVVAGRTPRMLIGSPS
jgi:succinoglycan biosynthesis transport protein ExoP